MKLFNKLFSKKKTPALMVDVKDEGVFINEQKIPFPASVANLSEIFGEPTRQYYDELLWRIIWDDKGICTECGAGALDNIESLRFLIKPENRLKHLPKNIFTGHILVNGQSVESTQKQWIKTKKYEIGKLKFKAEEDNAVYSYILMKSYDDKETKDSDKYKLKKIAGETIEFADFNFKLTVIEVLMYDKELLKPKFDVYEFAELYNKRKIDIDKEGYNPIPEVIEYFQALKIDKKLAEQVTEIYQDGGNNIYLNIIPLWSGEDDFFDIQSYEDIRHFPNLKKMILMGVEQKTLDELKAQGINAEAL